MLSGVSIVCFTGSYLVAFAMEIFRLLFKNPIRHIFLILAVSLGLIAHSAFLYHNQIAVDSGKLVNSVQGFFLLAAWGVACVYLYLSCIDPKIPFGLFLIPVILGLIFSGAFGANATPFSSQSVGQIWRAIHGLSVLLATFTVFISFVAGLMFLEQQRRLKKKIGQNSSVPLPSLEWTRTAAWHGIGFSTVMLAIGIFSGVLLNHLILAHEQRMVSASDPLVVGAMVLFLFLLLFLGTLTFYRPLQEGRRIAVLTVLCSLFLVAVLVFSLVSSDAHWKAKTSDTATINMRTREQTKFFRQRIPVEKVLNGFSKAGESVLISLGIIFMRGIPSEG